MLCTSMGLQMCIADSSRSGSKLCTLHFMMRPYWQRPPCIELCCFHIRLDCMQDAVALCLAVLEPCQGAGSDWGMCTELRSRLPRCLRRRKHPQLLKALVAVAIALSGTLRGGDELDASVFLYFLLPSMKIGRTSGKVWPLFPPSKRDTKCAVNGHKARSLSL